MKLNEICELISGELHGDGEIEIDGVSGIIEAQKNEITFLANPKYRKEIETTNAGAIIVGEEISDANGKAIIRVAEPYVAFMTVFQYFAKASQPIKLGIDETAKIGKNVKIGDRVSIQANVVIEDNCAIGDDVIIFPFVYVGNSAKIGDLTKVYSNVTIREICEIGDRVIIHSGAVIGSDGFGFATVGDRHHKIPQIGRVVIGDDVEIGANTTIDRATMTNAVTKIGRGTKIDNLVQIAHNVEIGEDCLIAAQVGISGSTKIADRVTIAGQAGFVGHLKVGSDNIFLARSGVTKDIPDRSGMISGFPARPHAEDLKILAHQRKLPEIRKTLIELQKRIAELEK